MTNRRGFLMSSAAFALCGSGCAMRGGGRENAALKAAMDAYVRDRLFGGIACASNRGDLVYTGNRTLTAADGPVTTESMFDFAGVVLASQMAGKNRTMGPRMQLLELMAK